MAVKTRQQLRDLWNTTINTNAVQAITGSLMNAGGIDIIDSMAMDGGVEDYQWFNNTDPTSLGTPSTGTYYAGIFDGKRWLKDDTGLITYSQSGLWTIYDNADIDFYPLEDWLGGLVRWTGASNGNIKLDNSVLNFSEGWHFGLYNNTPNNSISIVTEGTDIIRSYNNNFNIPAYSYANIGLISVNGVTEWYADIQQEYEYALGQLAKNTQSIIQAVTADTWTLVNNAAYVTGTLVNVVATANGGLQILYPDNGTNGVYVELNIMASIAIPSGNERLDLSFGVNGVISNVADVILQSAESGANQTADMFWPYSLAYQGIVPNGTIINPFIRYTDTDNIALISLSMTVKADALAGVDIEIQP